MPNGKRVTIKDIANESGYSKTAVSFAFNDPSRISEKARKQILSIADRLGYLPDPMARNFALHRHECIGFLLPQDVEDSLGNPYIDKVIEGIGTVCEENGYTLTLIPPLHSSTVNAVKNAMVDGLIAMGMRVSMDIVSILNTRQLPYVTIDGIPSQDMPSVNIQDEQAAYDMMRLVLSKGHKDIAVVSLSPDAFSSGEDDTVPKHRARGFTKAFRENGIDPQSVRQYVSECSFEAGLRIGNEITSLHTLPTAVVTMSDIVAIGILVSFKNHGLKVPEEISLVGFDNDISSTYVSPTLTTIDQPAKDKGRMAAKALFSVIAGNKLEDDHMVIPYSLEIRESLSVPRKN